MVHGIQFLKCKNGHILPISFDSNECGCHHKGKPCIKVSCPECLKQVMGKPIDEIEFNDITIPLDENGMKEVNKLLNN